MIVSRPDETNKLTLPEQAVNVGESPCRLPRFIEIVMPVQRGFSLLMLLLAVWFAVVVGPETFADEPTTATHLTAEDSGQTLPEQRTVPSLGVTDMIGAAEDFRFACEALERVGTKYADVVVEVAKSISKIGGEFDPFGYKNVSLVLARQTELIGAQQKIIFDLQTREIERLQDENRRLRKQLSVIDDSSR